MRVPSENSKEAGPPDLSKVFKYAKLSAEFIQTKKPETAQALREIERELGMSAEKIMDLALRNTDLFRKDKADTK